MMVQWADYGISGVHYDHQVERILNAAVVPNPYYTAEGQVVMTREEIIAALKGGKTFVFLSRFNSYRTIS